MLDLNLIRENPELVRTSLRNRQMDASPVDEILRLDEKRRSLLTQVESLKAERNAAGRMAFADGDDPDPPRRAFLGVRSCELHAIKIQDRVFLGSGAEDSHYGRRRSRIFTIGVSCGTAGGTCFCVSMNTGPEVTDRTPHDLAMTEVLDGPRHYFVLTAGSDAGRELLAALPTTPAAEAEVAAAAGRVASAAASMGRSMNPEGVRELLQRNLEHPQWDDVAQRCLTCANCTMVCPTCFCTSVTQSTDLAGTVATSSRTWDSCFSPGFAKVAGGSFRSRPRDRYRQWLTHKFATWIDQFGTSGCVGCGRCITWCPVGIDITEETAAIADSEKAGGSGHGDA